MPDFPISVDTRSSEVARYALENGVSVINDVSGMDYDSQIADVVAKYNATSSQIAINKSHIDKNGIAGVITTL